MRDREASGAPEGRGASGSDTKVEDGIGTGGTLSSVGAALPLIVVWSDTSSRAWRLSCRNAASSDQETARESASWTLLPQAACQTVQEKRDVGPKRSSLRGHFRGERRWVCDPIVGQSRCTSSNMLLEQALRTTCPAVLRL